MIIPHSTSICLNIDYHRMVTQYFLQCFFSLHAENNSSLPAQPFLQNIMVECTKWRISGIEKIVSLYHTYKYTQYTFVTLESLHRDGRDNDTGVFITVCFFSYTKFQEFRIQRLSRVCNDVSMFSFWISSILLRNFILLHTP